MDFLSSAQAHQLPVRHQRAPVRHQPAPVRHQRAPVRHQRAQNQMCHCRACPSPSTSLKSGQSSPARSRTGEDDAASFKIARPTG
jgi:hypothetical protein